MTLDIKNTRDLLQAMGFKALFNELGWNLPRNPKSITQIIQGNSYSLREIAQLAGVIVFEITSLDGSIPDAAGRRAIYKEILASFHENLLIFVDREKENERTQSLWYWVKRDGNKEYLREHLYVRGQPGDLFLGKLGSLVFELRGLPQIR